MKTKNQMLPTTTNAKQKRNKVTHHHPRKGVGKKKRKGKNEKSRDNKSLKKQKRNN